MHIAYRQLLITPEAVKWVKSQDPTSTLAKELHINLLTHPIWFVASSPGAT